MKICLVGEYSGKNWPGSATNKVQKYVASNLMLVGNKVSVFELPLVKGKIRKLFSKTKIIKKNGIEINQGGAINIINFLFKRNFDVIHFIVTRKYMLAALPVLSFLGSKIVSTFHDTLIFSVQKKSIENYIEYFLYHFLIYFSDKIFVYSEKDFTMIKKISKNKSTIIKNGVDTDFFSPYYEKSSENVIVFAGGLGKDYKGLKFLEDSLMAVSIKFKFNLCGENHFNLAHPNYTGALSQSEFRELIQHSSIVVIPSEYEPFSLNGLEAMACGTPIIITRNCGLANYLTDGEGCFIIDYGDIKHLSTRISLLLSDKLLHERMSYKAREIAEKFSWQNIIREYIFHYEN